MLHHWALATPLVSPVSTSPPACPTPPTLCPLPCVLSSAQLNASMKEFELQSILMISEAVLAEHELLRSMLLEPIMAYTQVRCAPCCCTFCNRGGSVVLFVLPAAACFALQVLVSALLHWPFGAAGACLFRFQKSHSHYT